MSGTPVIGLECKAAWCDLLLSGRKSVESRTYPLPEPCIGQKIWLLASGGTENVSSLGDTVAPGCADAEIVGWVSFGSVMSYQSQAEWEQDASRHCVSAHSPYAWKPGVTTEIYAWEVASRGRLAVPQPLPAMERLKRSLYMLQSEPEGRMS
ncbi:hypothetical protein WJX74_004894 [Apatococcus lobatus]|uniref:ASCH domain-containing protein n=2 Tax=Apatococcus TaxID=904362 RepID=A0AAW1SJ65_9CHLO